jgi:alpha-ketoglutarate-dependent taurine dioxygenase
MEELSNNTISEISSREVFRRKSVKISSQELINTEYLETEKNFPLVIKSNLRKVDLGVWASSNQDFIHEQLLQHGAILFRNFHVETVGAFEQVIKAICGEAMEYRYRASPRTQVSDRIYTSTDYPADQSIFPHNEHAYSPTFPLKIFFFCLTPAQQGGETPVGSSRMIFERIDPKIRERFIQKKVMYMRNFGDGFGLPWQTVFQTTEKAQVEEYCRLHNIEFEWKDSERLRTRQIGPAVVKHPQTGEIVWFNHATFFHISTLEKTTQEALLASFREEDLPTNTYYGDGSAIESSVLESLRQIYQQEMVSFPWQKGDILMLDNILAVHGRYPFLGARKVLVGMAEAMNIKDCSVVK